MEASQGLSRRTKEPQKFLTGTPRCSEHYGRCPSRAWRPLQRDPMTSGPLAVVDDIRRAKSLAASSYTTTPQRRGPPAALERIIDHRRRSLRTHHPVIYRVSPPVAIGASVLPGTMATKRAPSQFPGCWTRPPIATLVECTTRYVMLVYLPERHSAEAVRDGLVRAMNARLACVGPRLGIRASRWHPTNRSPRPRCAADCCPSDCANLPSISVYAISRAIARVRAKCCPPGPPVPAIDARPGPGFSKVSTQTDVSLLGETV